MDTTNDRPTTTTTATQRWLNAIAGGAGMPDDLFAEDVVFDATVPNWRYETTGRAAVTSELAQWYRHPTTVERRQERTIDGGVAIELDLSWEDGGVPHAAHQLHLLSIEDGRITRDVAFCGGRWHADLIADMEAARAR